MPAPVYIESSVISYLTTKPGHDIVTAVRHTIMLDWWRRKKIISELLPFLVTSRYGLLTWVFSPSDPERDWSLARVDQDWLRTNCGIAYGLRPWTADALFTSNGKWPVWDSTQGKGWHWKSTLLFSDRAANHYPARIYQEIASDPTKRVSARA